MLINLSYWTTVNMPSMFMVIMSLLSMFYFRKQMLISLISLELVMLSLFLMLMITYSEMLQPISICFYMLILGACEASLGLSLMVMMTRMKGNDMLSLISNYKY